MSINKSLSLKVNSIIIVYTILSLFIIAFVEIESSGAVPIQGFYLPYNKSLYLFVLSIIVSVVILFKVGIKKNTFNKVFMLLILKAAYDLLAVFQGRVAVDETFLYHYSMVLVMPFFYYIYRNFSGNCINIIKLISYFAIILVIQELYTVIINGYSFSSPDYKNYLRIPAAHSNIIAVILLSILVIRLRISSSTYAFSWYNVIIFIGILLTQSRGATIFIIGWWVLILYEKKYGRLSKTAILKFSLTLTLILLIILCIPAVQILLFETTINDIYFWSRATAGRTDLLLLGFVKFIENPIWGSGLGVEDYDLGYEVVQAGVHNIVLDYLIQSGIIGTIIYGLAIYYVFKLKNRNLRQNISRALKLSIWVILGYSMVEVCYFNFSCLFFFWSFCGLYDRISGMSEKNQYRLMKRVENKKRIVV